MTDVEAGGHGTRGLGWPAIAVAIPILGQLAALMVLSRILEPSEIGLAALATTVTAFANVFLNSGLSAFVVHTSQITQTQLSAVFWINALMALTLAAAVATLATPIAAALGSPDLTPLLLVSSFSLLVGLGAVHLGMLERAFRFQIVAVIDAIATVVGQGTAIILAVSGVGAVSIVIGAVLVQAFQSSAYWMATRWRPSPRLGWPAISEVLRYSLHVTAFNAINYWSRNLDNLIVGADGQTAILGQYTRSYQLMTLPVNLIGNTVGRMVLPAISELYRESLNAGSRWFDYALASAAAGVPIAAVIVTMPEVVFDTVLGPGWSQAADFAAILAVGIPPQLVMRTTGALFMGLGRTRSMLILGAINTVVTVISMIVGMALAGVIGVCIGVTAAMWIHLAIFMMYLKVIINQDGTSIFVFRLAVITVFGAISAFSIYGMDLLVHQWFGIVRLAIAVLCGFATTSLLLWVFERRVATMIINLIRGH